MVLALEPWRRSAGVSAELWASCKVQHPDLAGLLRTVADVPWDRLRTVVGSPQLAEAPGTPLRAWLGPCDGKGAFVALFEVCAPHGQSVLVSVVARLTEGLRDTLVSAPDLRDSVAAAVDELYAETHPRPVPVDSALRAVGAVVERFGADPDPAHALDILRPSLRGLSAEQPPAADSGPVSLADALSLLTRPETANSWWIDFEDLRRANQTGGDVATPLAIARGDFADRYPAMARYMARRAAACGDAAAAGAFGWLAADAAHDLAKSILLAALLERTSVIAPQSPDHGGETGDDELPLHATIDDLADLFEQSSHARELPPAELRRLREAMHHVLATEPRSRRQ
ncbi:MAG: hypothetical protein H0V89_11525 [Deltaproteobacteria bacterium]|nr:hypothetical protein [Deltaproteobacteria bacterium]